MSHLPRLNREPIRPDKEPGSDPEIWKPNWKCFCCHDRGDVYLTLVKLVIPDYDHNRDKPVRCQHPRCEAGRNYAGNEQYDQRFTAPICIELDQAERSNWQNYVDDQRERLRVQQLIKDAAQGKAMRKTMKERTANDEREVQQRAAEIEAIPHEKWMEMSQQYLGSPQEYADAG